MTTNVFLNGNTLTDSAGHPVMARPAVTMNTKTELILTQLDRSGNAGTIASWEFTVNEECNATDSVKLRITQGITTDSSGAVHVDLGNTVSQELLTAMGHSPSKRMFGELAGYTSGTSVPVRCMQFPLTIRNRVGGGTFTPAAVSGTLTEAQVRAIVAEQPFEQEQADWAQTDSTEADYIKNKPSIPAAIANLTEDSTHRTVTDAEKTAWNGKADPEDIPSLTGYATETWVTQRGYLTEHQSLGNYQTKITADNKLSYSLISGTPSIPAAISDLTDDSSHRTVTDAEKTAWNGKADPEDIPSLTGYATETWVTQRGYLTEHQSLDNYQTKITADNKLPYSLISGTPSIPAAISDLTDDSSHRTVTDAEKTAWNGKMSLPEGGTAGQFLTKNADGQVWKDAPVTSVNGGTGTVVLTPEDLGIQIRLGACTGLGVCGKLFSWIDPENVTLNASTLGTWDQTVLVRKEGTAYPTNPADGVTLVSTSRTLGNKNYYQNHSFEDTSAQSGVNYRYKLFSRTTTGTWNALSGNEFSESAGCSWNQVQQFVRAGRGPVLWPIGTVFYVQHSEYASDSNGLAFRVVGYDQVPAADSTLTHTMCLETVDLLFKAPYDASEKLYALTEDTAALSGKSYYKYENSTYTALVEGTDYNVGDAVPANSWYEKNNASRASYGNNYYPHSNLLQWANSSGNANEWFVPKHIWDTCSTTLSEKNGFLKNLESDFLNVVKPASLTTGRISLDGGGSLTTATDRFWPLSVTQVFGELNSAIRENVQLQYYAEGGDAAKKIIGQTATFQWRLRSPSVATGSTHNTFYVRNTGVYDGDISGAFNPYGISLACIIA